MPEWREEGRFAPGVDRKVGFAMRRRKGSFPRGRHLALAAALGAGIAIVPAVASSETTPTVSAVQEPGAYGSPGSFRWSPSQVEIASSGAVAFQNTSATVLHGVEWTGGPETPSCQGVPINEGKTGWKGTCTFTHSGTYTFRCVVHPTEMTGTVTVNQNGTMTTTTTGTTSPTETTTTTSTTPPPSSGSPLAGSASQALKLAKSQRGGSVRGSVAISQAGTGGRLEVDLFAGSASLAKVKHHARVRVGRLVRSSLRAGRVSFVVSLSRRARGALRRHRRLALMVRIIVTPSSGASVTLTRAVVEHG